MKELNVENQIDLVPSLRWVMGQIFDDQMLAAAYIHLYYQCILF